MLKQLNVRSVETLLSYNLSFGKEYHLMSPTGQEVPFQSSVRCGNCGSIPKSMMKTALQQGE